MVSKVALVTGASSGIGAATVKRLLADGYMVYGAARRVERMEELGGLGARLLRMDVTDDQSMREGLARIIEECGRIDVLVNNAGYGAYGSLEDTPIAEGRRQMEVNVIGLARVTQLVVPHMRLARSGKIVNISSIGGKLGEPLGGWYHASKYAVEGLSDSLRPELAEFGIDVIVIEPGAIATEWSQIAAEGLLKVSGQTAYARQAKVRAAVLAFGPEQSSPPEVVAETIVRALRAKRPKARYPTGKFAGLLMFMRKVLSDRAFDAFLAMALGHVAQGRRREQEPRP
jgi:NAD(P)-dependent dehydrogenase (short-subunit alcohol dehydrogenase family)